MSLDWTDSSSIRIHPRSAHHWERRPLAGEFGTPSTVSARTMLPSTSSISDPVLLTLTRFDLRMNGGCNQRTRFRLKGHHPPSQSCVPASPRHQGATEPAADRFLQPAPETKIPDPTPKLYVKEQTPAAVRRHPAHGMSRLTPNLHTCWKMARLFSPF